MHHVAGLPAELWRIHVRRAPIARHRHHQKVHDRSHQNDVQPMAKDLVVEIDLGKLGGNQSRLLQLSAPQKHAHGNQQQPGYEQSRQKQEEDDAKIGIVVGPAEQFHQPIADHGHAGGARNRAPGKADGIVAEKQRRPHPALTKSLKHSRLPPAFKSMPANENETSIAAPRKALYRVLISCGNLHAMDTDFGTPALVSLQGGPVTAGRNPYRPGGSGCGLSICKPR